MAQLNNTIVNGQLRVLGETDTAISVVGSGGIDSTDSENKNKSYVKGGKLVIENFGTALTLGAQNSSYCHMISTKPFYINNQIEIAHNILPYTTGSYTLGSSTNKWASLHTQQIYLNGSTIESVIDGKIQTAVTTVINSDY